MKLFLFILLLFLAISCSKVDSPEPEKQQDKDINSISYNFKGKVSEIKVPKYTVLITKVIYTVSSKEIAPNGYQIWQTVKESKYKTEYIVNKKILTTRSDTIEFKFDLWNYISGKTGDTIFLSSELLGMKTTDTGSILAKIVPIPIIIVDK